MIPPADALLVLDTNVVIQLARDNEVGRRIWEQVAMPQRRERPLISIITVGECLALARQFAWHEKRIESLRNLLAQLVVVDVNRPGILDRYAEITHFARTAGQAPSDNDRWIAATASIAQAWLVTTDRDFDFLDPRYLRRTWIDPTRSPEPES